MSIWHMSLMRCLYTQADLDPCLFLAYLVSPIRVICLG